MAKHSQGLLQVWIFVFLLFEKKKGIYFFDHSRCWASRVCSSVLPTDNISAVEMDPLHLEVRPYIQSWARWKKKKRKKNPLGFIFPASAILLWVCSEICFHQADSIRELGNEKSAMELDGGGGEGGGIVQRRAGRNGREGRSNSYLKRAYPSSFLDFIIRYVWDNSVEWNKVILPPQKAESPWSSPSALTWFQSERFSDGAAGK